MDRLTPALRHWQAQGGMVALSGHRLFVAQAGQHGSVLLFIHGYPTSSYDWHPLWAPLATRHRLIAPDLLGMGFSDKPADHAYGIENHADLLEALLDRLDVAVRNLGDAERVLAVEFASVTDNPLIFPDTGDVVSGGNFHGQPLALHLDFLAIAMSELANISERRTYLMVSGQRGLPPFLAPDAGLNSGFMIAQYSAAALVSENKILAHPASVDSIPSSANQEDHVSMAAHGARRLLEMAANLGHVIGIEYLAAAQRYGSAFGRGLDRAPPQYRYRADPCACL